jgi:hypothetical protein
MFVRSYNPVWYFVDLSGIQMDDSDYFFVLQNVFPYLPAKVYHDPEGTIPWTSPIQLLPNGTLPVDIYFDPTQTYRLEWRAGPTQASALIYLVQNYVPSSEGNNPTPGTTTNTDNQISNPQFAFVNFSPSLTITTAGTYNIAPGWFLQLTGAGTVSTILTQQTVSGNQNFPGNPPYVLSIVNAGWTSAILYQRFQNSGGIWANEAINTSLTGISESGTLPISMVYQPSTGAGVPIANGNLIPSVYSVIGGGVAIPASTSTDLGNSAYVDFQVILPPVGSFKITNLQLIAGNQDLITTDPSLVPYIQDTLERQQDHLFHYYANSLITKPKNNILVGWDFPLNPYQFNTEVITTQTAITSYVADQTILHQEAASQLQTGAAAQIYRGGFEVKAVANATTTRFALIQYIDPLSIQPWWSYLVSALARVRIFNDTTTPASVRLKMRLIYRTSLPSVISPTEPIASWSANSDPTFSAGWTAIAPLNDPSYVLPSAFSTFETPGANAFPAFSFDQFPLPNESGTTQVLGVVIYTMDNLTSVGSQDYVIFDKVSLVPAKFGTDASPETFDEVLRKCQYYYETSYYPANLPGATTTTGQIEKPSQITNISGVDTVYKANFSLQFSQYKRVAPVLGATSGPSIRFYNPHTGTVDTIGVGIWGNGGFSTSDPQNIASSQWTAISTNYNLNMNSNDVNASSTVSHTNGFQGAMVFQYFVDTRLGV